jgi:hypothetical protein
MKQDNLQDKIAKLPLWARDHITKIEREREVAVQALNEYCDTQTPAPFYCDEYESTGEDREPTSKRRYFQGHRITVEWLGVRLGVLLRKDNNKIVSADLLGSQRQHVSLETERLILDTCFYVALKPQLHPFLWGN